MAVTVPAAGDDIEAAFGIAVARHVNARATQSGSGTITTTETKLVNLTIPANTFETGSAYRLEGWGVCTSSGTNAVTFRVRVGTTTLTGNIAGGRAPTATATASADGFKVEALFVVRSTGASGTCVAQMLTHGGPTQPFNTTTFETVTNSTVTVDTTVQNLLELTCVTAAVGTSINVYSATIERVV